MSEVETYESDYAKNDIFLIERKNNNQDMNIIITRAVKKYSCLWNKKDHSYRDQAKRNAAWNKVANQLKISELEAKKLWKRAYDSRRYFTQIKTKRKSLEKTEKGKYLVNLSETESFEKIKIENDDQEIHDQFLNETSHDVYHDQFLNEISPDIYLESQNETSQSSSNPINNDQNEKINEKLKHIHIWYQLEKLFEQLDEDKITDLNFQFFKVTYDAILEMRKNRTRNYT